MECIILEEWSGKTVKSFLYSELKLTRAQVTELKKREKGILLDGKRVFVTEKLYRGNRLSLSLEDEESAENLVPFDCPIEVLYEDKDLLIVNKPPFMPTHPSLHHYSDTLANALAFYYMKKGTPFVFRAANRLDRDTSGSLLVAKNKRTAALLAKMIAERQVDKQYTALLDGEIEEENGWIDKNIVRAEESMIMRKTDDLSGDSAQTEYHVIKRSGGKTLVRAIPHTGRTHQLRVHFAYIGHPIVGDTMYGKEDRAIGRQALHASSLSFVHPVTNEKLTVNAPLPEDMKDLLEEYGFEKDLL